MTRKSDKESIITRTREVRSAMFDEQKDMAKALGIEYGTYNKYETRSVLPHDLIERFCNIAGVSVEYLITGREHPVLNAYYKLDPSSKERIAVDQFLNIGPTTNKG